MRKPLNTITKARTGAQTIGSLTVSTSGLRNESQTRLQYMRIAKQPT
jgi:hypothetical protein